LLDHQSNYVKRLNIDNKTAKNINILAINLNVLNNYFDGSNEIIFCAERTILLDTDLKIISLDHQNNFEILKTMSNAAKNFDILVKRST